jgi:hypothetical protein
MARSPDADLSLSGRLMRIPSIFDLPLSESDAKLFPQHQSLCPNPRLTTSRKTWTPEEDDRLMHAMSGQTDVCWSVIASTVGGHTAKQCRERWLVKLNPSVRRSPFEPWEDEIIQAECQRIGTHWSVIAQLLPGRTSCSVKNRWYAVLRFRPILHQIPASCFGMPRNVPHLTTVSSCDFCEGVQKIDVVINH